MRRVVAVVPYLLFLTRVGESARGAGVEMVPQDAERYQTVYAQRAGAVAAPTAGLHFTPEQMPALRRRGAHCVFVTLHVGAGTFQPVRTERIAEYRMHAERFEVPPATAAAINAARAAGRPVTAVGTTSLRTLESAVRIDREKFRIIVAGCSGGAQKTGEYLREAERRGLPAVRLEESGPLDPGVVRQVLRLIDQYEVDIIHTHEFRSNAVGLVCARLS